MFSWFTVTSPDTSEFWIEPERKTTKTANRLHVPLHQRIANDVSDDVNTSRLCISTPRHALHCTTRTGSILYGFRRNAVVRKPQAASFTKHKRPCHIVRYSFALYFVCAPVRRRRRRTRGRADGSRKNQPPVISNISSSICLFTYFPRSAGFFFCRQKRKRRKSYDRPTDEIAVDSLPRDSSL
jgi:hypothetical protein